MQVACYARVSTHQQQQEGTLESQRRALQHHIQHHGWFLLPEHEYLDEGISGARLDRPALANLVIISFPPVGNEADLTLWERPRRGGAVGWSRDEEPGA